MNTNPLAQKVFLHGAFLAASNLFSGIFILTLSLVFDFQIDPSMYWITMLLLTVFLYYLIYVLTKKADIDIMVLSNLWVPFAVLAVSLILAPLLFHAIHFMASKAAWNWEYTKNTIPHQLVINSVCLILNFIIAGKSKIKEG